MTPLTPQGGAAGPTADRERSAKGDPLPLALEHLICAKTALLVDIERHHATSDSHPAVFEALSLTTDAVSEVRGELKEREQYPLYDEDAVRLTKREVLG